MTKAHNKITILKIGNKKCKINRNIEKITMTKAHKITNHKNLNKKWKLKDKKQTKT